MDCSRLRGFGVTGLTFATDAFFLGETLVACFGAFVAATLGERFDNLTEDIDVAGKRFRKILLAIVACWTMTAVWLLF